MLYHSKKENGKAMVIQRGVCVCVWGAGVIVKVGKFQTRHKYAIIICMNKYMKFQSRT